jgi:hypothetical protein
MGIHYFRLQYWFPRPACISARIPLDLSVILFHGEDLGVDLVYLCEGPVADVQDLPVLLFNGEDPSCVRYPTPVCASVKYRVRTIN